MKMRYSLDVRLSCIQVIKVSGANMLGHLPLGLQAAHLGHDQSPMVCMLVQTDMQDSIALSCTLQHHLMPQSKLLSLPPHSSWLIQGTGSDHVIACVEIQVYARQRTSHLHVMRQQAWTCLWHYLKLQFACCVRPCHKRHMSTSGWRFKSNYGALCKLYLANTSRCKQNNGITRCGVDTTCPQ